MAETASSETVDADEVARFAAMSEAWWDPEGPFRPLHRLNPARLAYIRDRLAERFGRDVRAPRPLHDLSVLDIGCGGGLTAEPLARLGARVTGIDAAAESVRIAGDHAAEGGLDIAYRTAAAEDLIAEGRSFDAVLALEVIEHAADARAFAAAAAALVAPGGALVMSTLNRTARAFALGVVGAEYLLGWLPRGTHDWRRFLRPSELAALLRAEGLVVEDVAGLGYDPLAEEWRVVSSVAVNYVLFATRGAG